MVFDAPLCRRMLEFVDTYAADVEVQPKRGQPSKTTSADFIATLMTQDVYDQAPPALVLARQASQLVLCLASEEWAQVGGPEPYHDSYTYSVFTHEDIGGCLIAFLAAGNGADGWSLSPEVKPASSETAEEFFATRGARARPGRLEELLRRVPKRPPIPGDEIE